MNVKILSGMLLSIAAAALLLAPHASRSRLAAQDNPASSRHNYFAAVDAVMPAKLDDWTSPDGWRAIVRIVPAFEVEFHVAIQKPFEASPIRATVTRPAGAPLGKQLRDAREKRPDLTFSQALEVLSLERTDLSEEACPDLVKLTGELEELKLPAAPPNLLIMDCTSFDVDIQTAYGGRTSFSFCGPPGGLEEAPLSKWALRLRNTLSENCLP